MGTLTAKNHLTPDAALDPQRMGRGSDAATRKNAPVPHSALRTPHAARRAGFTLIELLVVITIMVILVTLTITAVNFSLDTERIRGAARQMQSYLEGARDRAIYTKKPVGVRFLLDQTLDPNNPSNARIVSSMVYISVSDPWSQGLIHLERRDLVDNTTGNPPPDGIADAQEIKVIRADANNPTGWLSLAQRGLLVDGARMKIPGDDSGSWYTVQIAPLAGPDGQPGFDNVDDDGNGVVDDFPEFGAAGSDDVDGVLWFTTKYRDPGASLVTSSIDAYPGRSPFTYLLELQAWVVEGQEPVLLARNIVIDLDGSRLPPGWRPGGSYSAYMDVMFSPRGTVIGKASSTGLIHFYLAELADTEAVIIAGRPAIPSVPGDGPGPDGILGTADDSFTYGSPPQPVGDRLIVSVFTQTGAISTHPVDTTDQFNNSTGAAGADGWADDPYGFAMRGEVAGQ